MIQTLRITGKFTSTSYLICHLYSDFESLLQVQSLDLKPKQLFTTMNFCTLTQTKGTCHSLFRVLTQTISYISSPSYLLQSVSSTLSRRLLHPLFDPNTPQDLRFTSLCSSFLFTNSLSSRQLSNSFYYCLEW